MSRRIVALVAGLTAALAAPAPAVAQTSYPEGPELPQAPAKPSGKARTYTVCAKQRRGCDFTSIQKAIDRARAGDTVKVRAGTYRGGVTISDRKSYLRLIGDAKRPRKVVIDGARSRRNQNGVYVNGAHEVTVRGLHVRNFKGNGIFVVNADGYTIRDNVAELTGVYGIYAFHTVGGVMRDNEAYYHNDAGLYIGETPPQRNPKRAFVRGNDVWGNVLGFSATNMRYATLTGNRFYNNAIGIAPNGLDSEKYPPADDNEIVGNEIFWNNFNHYAGAPFPLKTEGVAAIAPPGIGVLLLGAHNTRIEDNDIYGNYLGGVALVESPFMADVTLRKTRGNQIVANRFGKAADKNGRDVVYDGNGSGNCFAGNVGLEVTEPADGRTLAPCPFSGENVYDAATTDLAVNRMVNDPTHTAFWIRHPHAPRPDGIEPLEVFGR